MSQIGLNQSSLLSTSSSDIGQVPNIQPRLCILRKWSHYDGYGVYLGRNEHWLGLRVDTVEANSPAESAGLLHGDIVIAINGHLVENDDFFTILSFLEHEVEQGQIRFLVLDPNSAELARRHHININENNVNCIQMETSEIKQKSSHDIHTLLSDSNPNTNLKTETRMCSVILSSGDDIIGISIQADNDFGHIITKVESNSPAARAGIEENDCIISVNNIVLIYKPFEDVLYFLKKCRNQSKLNFLLAKKSYLLETSPNHLSSSVIQRNRSNTLPNTDINDQSTRNEKRDTIISMTDEQYDSLSLQIYNNRYNTKNKKRQGRILRGIGPATAHRYSWSVASERTVDYSSIIYDLYDRKPVMDEPKKRRSIMKSAFKALQVGFTNPSPAPTSRRSSARNRSVSFYDTEQRIVQSPLAVARQQNSPKAPSSPNLEVSSNRLVRTPSPSLKHKETINNIVNATPITPVQMSPVMRVKKQDRILQFQSNLRLATVPISDLTNHGYDLHDIKLMQASEEIPVGFKLTKQNDPLQYLITVVVELSKADEAGLKIDDWIIKIEDKDIRLTDLHDVSQDIHQLLNNQGYINMLIARKKPSTLSILIDDPRSSAITYDLPAEKNILLSVGLSNRIEEESTKSLSTDDYSVIQYEPINKDKIRYITLKEATGLYFDSFTPDNKNPTHQLHFIKNIQPISMSYRSGLRNNDRIIAVNNTDVTHMKHEDVRALIIKKQPVELTVVNDPKTVELIEKYKTNQKRMTCSSLIYESIEQQSKDLDNILFIDDYGPIYMKHCVIKKDTDYNVLGFLLHYIDNVHVVGNVEENYPAYNNGLRNDDVILFINNQNIELMTHSDVTMLLHSLVQSNEIVDLILINKTDVERYKNYKEKSFINWKNILEQNNQDDQAIYVNQYSTSTLLSGARTCVLEIENARSAGFTISGRDPPPFTICKITKDSPAEKAGLKLNDSLLSINGKSVIDASYEKTIQIIKDALIEQKTIPIVVNQLPSTKKKPYSLISTGDEASDAQSIDSTNATDESNPRSKNAVEQYQRQRVKELSYTLRLCHLNASNHDGTPASTFGFEMSEDPHYEYPKISRVEPKLAGERSGLQTNDILIKVNDRKTKGLDFDKVKKLIDKAKRDGRLEMLVADQNTYDYCKRTNKKFKEPYIKVKHIFPRSRSSNNFQRLPLLARTSQGSMERLKTGTSFDTLRVSIQEEDSSALDGNTGSEISSSVKGSDATHTFFPYGVSQNDASSTKEVQSEESIVNIILHAISHFFQNTKTGKSLQLVDYDIPFDRTNESQNYAPLSPTVRFQETVSQRVRHVSQTYTICSNQSNGFYDYIRDPRRCTLNIDREKGLGFVLSASADFNHRITGVDEKSIAEAAGLRVNDDIVEVNGINVRNTKYEEVVDMLISAMRTDEKIEICVINGRPNALSPTEVHTKNKRTNIDGLLNGNHNNNNNYITATQATTDDQSDKHSLDEQSKCLSNTNDRDFSENILAFSTGITGSPKDVRSPKTSGNSLKKGFTSKVLNISKKDAPVARLCRVRKFPSSPFYGFFLCGNPKELGEIYVSNIAKNSSAAICGLRDGDHIIEVNGTSIEDLTYETILNKIRSHMEQQNLELLVLDKKSVRWYRERNYPITSQTLPTILHIEPIINDIKSKVPTSPTFDSHTENDDSGERRISTTTL